MNQHRASKPRCIGIRNIISVAAVGVSLTVLSFLLAAPRGVSGPFDALSCSAALGQPVPIENSGLALPLRLLSWNIQKSQTLGWEKDLQELGADLDLLLIQEASTQAMIANALPQALYQAFAAGYTTKSQTTGVLTLSSVAPSLQCNLTAWEPWLGTPKATNITEYPLADSEHRLLVINLHAVNFTVGLEDFVKQVEALSPLISTHQGPLLVAGDFNTWSEKRRSHLEGFMATHQLTAVDFTPDHRTTFWDMPLDHMYLRGLRAIEASAIAVDTSDHNPLLVTVEITL